MLCSMPCGKQDQHRRERKASCTRKLVERCSCHLYRLHCKWHAVPGWLNASFLQDGSASPRRNWTRKWFRIEGSRLDYFEDKEASEKSNASPLWSGDLATAEVLAYASRLKWVFLTYSSTARFVSSPPCYHAPSRSSALFLTLKCRVYFDSF